VFGIVFILMRISVVFSIFSFLKKDFIYLFERERENESMSRVEGLREREKQAPC